MTTTTARPVSQHQESRAKTFVQSDDAVTPIVVLGAAFALCLAVAVIHLQDQGGLLGNESPTWIKLGYYAIEIASGLAAGLVIRGKTAGWLLALGSAVMPMAGYLLTRTVGVPGDHDDIGNWGYTLGTVSLLVEGALIVLAVIAIVRIARRQAENSPFGQRAETVRCAR